MNAGLSNYSLGCVGQVEVSTIILTFITPSCLRSFRVCGLSIVTNTGLAIVSSKCGCVLIAK